MRLRPVRAKSVTGAFGFYGWYLQRGKVADKRTVLNELRLERVRSERGKETYRETSRVPRVVF